MISIGGNKILGIAMGPSAMQIAEITRHHGECKVLRTACCSYPDDLTIAKPLELGRVLGKLLRKEGFFTRCAIIGLPSKWLLTRRREMPPATAEVLARSLRLYAEGEFSAELKDITLDYAGIATPSAAQGILLLGTSRSYLENSRALAKAAGLRLKAVTVTGAALCPLAQGVSGDASLLLFLHKDYGELIPQYHGTPVQLRHVPLADDTTEHLIGALRRVLAGLPAGVAPATVFLAGEGPQLASLPAAIKDRLGLTTQLLDLSSLGGNRDLLPFAHALALALAWLQKTPGMVDFLHSRLTPPKVHDKRKQWIWGGAIAATLLLAVCACLYNLQHQQQQLAYLKSFLTTRAGDIKEAQTRADRLTTAQAWSGGTPRFLACLGELTTLFPDEGTIWATNLSVHQDLTGQLSGKAASEQQVLALLDKIKDSKRFMDPKLLEMRDSSKTTHEIAFSISFAFKSPE